MAGVTVAEMRDLEAAAMAAGRSEESLMREAGEALGEWLARHFGRPGTALGFLGKGHNAGDALVALRVLRDRHGWRVGLRPAARRDECAPLTRRMWDELEAGGGCDAFVAEREPRFAARPLLCLDGLLGIGARGALRGGLPALAAEMAALRQRHGAWVVAVDQPSGVDADSGEIHPGAVLADLTLMIGAAKRGLLLGAAANACGALGLVPVTDLAGPRADGGRIDPLAWDGPAPRPFDFHKGLAGRVAVLAGSADYGGAAALVARGALRGGAGLVTLLVPAAALAAVRALAPAEAIVREREAWLAGDPMALAADAWVLGPGLGRPDDALSAALERLLDERQRPVLWDADGLNWLAAEPARLGRLAGNHVLTPHPGEFRRLAPGLADEPRERAVERYFEGGRQGVLVLKGARTLVAEAGGALWTNGTGGPGMSTGGQGDLLAGVAGALLASGEPPPSAAARAVWLCGRAAERAILHGGQSEESLLPSDVAEALGGAFRDWREAAR